MSTHFRPRPQPPPTPTSPVRPSTAHSTIRAITPSPPNSPDTNFPLPRPKSEHALGSLDIATFKQYVLKAEAGGFSNTPVADAGVKLQRGGIASGRTSPIKSGRSSLVKSGRSSSVKARSKSPRKRALSTLEGFAESPTRDDSPMVNSPIQTPSQKQHEEQKEEHVEDNEHEACPDTPTPMTREQKRQAYTPLSIPAYRPPQLTRPSQESPPQPRKVIPNPNNKDRISVSVTSNHTALSTASKHSIFSTPGRDEMERKKALVEVDEGPFARAKSMVDLREERRRVSGGADEDGAKEIRLGLGKFRCGVGCVVM